MLMSFVHFFLCSFCPAFINRFEAASDISGLSEYSRNARGTISRSESHIQFLYSL